MTAAPSVPNMQARGTSRFGFSTAAEFCAADSIPRNAHRVSAMLEPIPAPMLSPCGFHACRNVSALNQNQPRMQRSPTGTRTPQTVMEPIFPVTLGPPKFATVVSQISPMTPMVVAIGVEASDGTKLARYPTAEMAIATLPMASDRKYRKNTMKYPGFPYASSAYADMP